MPAKTTTLAQDTIRGTRGEIRGPQLPNDPFRGGLTYHFGDKVTKNISNYGDAEFVCISDKAPYYFIHVSSKKYSMSEKDAMHYSQTGYAATTDLLKVVAKEIQPHIFDMIDNYNCLHDEDGYDFYCWNTADITNAAKVLSQYIPVNDPNYQFNDDTDQFTFTSEEFWVSNSHDYPYAQITWNNHGCVRKGESKSSSSFNSVEVDDAHHWSYASPCGGHRFFFIAKTND